jgi:hypothetical protein
VPFTTWTAGTGRGKILWTCEKSAAISIPFQGTSSTRPRASARSTSAGTRIRPAPVRRPSGAGSRPGTENVAGIVALGVAAELAKKKPREVG